MFGFARACEKKIIFCLKVYVYITNAGASVWMDVVDINGLIH